MSKLTCHVCANPGSISGLAKGLSRHGWSIALFFFIGATFLAPILAQVCTPPPAGMVSWWPGDGHARDIQGSNNGRLLGGTTFAPGVVGQAFSFDGMGAYVEVPDNA